ncbi:hypothetical protein AGMMS49938_03930 [Fibrobacterales bacterium]|nr:hypothetical protein AGMMS49938_03930 [Fibrobacterales bacterium]
MREIQFLVSIGDDGLNRVRTSIMTERGQLINGVRQYESMIGGNWVSIVRYDCAHGKFHKDVLWPNGDKEKRFFEFDTLKAAFDYADNDLKERWKWYREMYISNMRGKK